MSALFEDTIKTIKVGPVEARPGELVCGWFDIAELPTGHTERLPVMIAQGHEPGPVFWLTANIHGDELTGMIAIQEIVRPELVGRLKGTVVAIPSLNPAGLRVERRQPYFDHQDPNRTFPGFSRPNVDHSNEERIQKTPSIYEDAMGRLFEAIKATADYLIDLHCYGLQSATFTIRDRVLYHQESERAAAEELYRRTDALCQAFGLPVVNESQAGRYIDAKLHRSTSGAALNEARIPAITVELGLIGGVDPQALAAARTGIYNTLKWAGMLEGEPENIDSVPVPQVSFNTRRENEPRACASGIIRYHVRPGDIVGKGDLIATLSDIFGRPLPEHSQARAENDGWIISLSRGGICYQGQTIVNMAVRDDEPMVERFPE